MRAKIWVVSFVVLLGLLTSAWAQTTISGSLTGMVKDPKA